MNKGRYFLIIEKYVIFRQLMLYPTKIPIERYKLNLKLLKVCYISSYIIFNKIR